MIYYNINGVKFANPYATFLHASIYETHTFPKFDFYDDVFSTINWTVEPLESFQSLCDKRAYQLRNKYSKLVLAFSGGTDSITVYNTFLRNNIHIDEIYVSYSGNSNPEYMSKDIVNWLIQNHPDKTTKIVTKSAFDDVGIKEFETQVTSEDFLVTKNLSSHFKYNCPLLDQTIISRLFSNNNYCVVTGHEKPYLIKENDGYYFTFLDGTFGVVMMRPEMEFFFVSPDLPELHAKQCHMMLNYCLQTGTSLNELEKFDNYYLKCAVQGRDPEPVILYGSSLAEKKSTRFHREILKSINFTKEVPQSIIAQLRSSQSGSTLAKGFKSQSDAFKNYVGGWHVLQTDQTLLSYMTRHKLLSFDKQPIQTYYNIMSKKHKIKGIK